MKTEGTLTLSTVQTPQTRCPNCGSAFVCGVTSVPFVCECQNLRLTPDEAASLRERFGSQCLCRACLQKMQAERDAQ